MRTDNVPIHEFEYKGYKCAVIEGAGYKTGDPYCFGWGDKEYGSNENAFYNFNASDKNPVILDEAVAKIKHEIDRWVSLCVAPPQYSGKVCKCGYKFQVVDFIATLPSGEEICFKCSCDETIKHADELKKKTGRQPCVTCLQHGIVHYLD